MISGMSANKLTLLHTSRYVIKTYLEKFNMLKKYF